LPGPAALAWLAAAALALALTRAASATPNAAARMTERYAPIFGALDLSWQAWLLIAVGFAATVAGSAMLYRDARAARRREQELAHDRAALTEAVARAEAKSGQLQATLTGMSDAVMMLDADLRLVEWNDNFPEFTGVPRAMLRVGRPMEEMIRAQALAGEFGAVDVEAEVRRRMAIMRAYRGGSPYERIRPSGQALELRRSPLPGGGFVTLYTDVTARKAAEAAQREARRLAEAAIEQRAQFVAMVSHEIRGLLSAVTSSFTLLDQSGLNEHQRVLASTGRQAGTELLELISDVLDLARIDAGRPTLRASDFEVAEVLRGVRQMFTATAAARGIALAVSVAPEVPVRLYADPQRLRQILINFTSNACKYSRPGTVTLRAEMQRSGKTEMLRLAVRDQGPRIPEQQATLLFVPFARLDNARESDAPGTGLGLAICERLSRLMGGQIGVAPAPAEQGEQDGNEFWVTIPLKAEDRGAVSIQGQAGRRRRARRTSVLLVEDVASNRMLTAALLRRAGNRVDVAESGEEAIRLVQSNLYDMVFMDLVMPGIGGYEAARRVRSLSGPAGRMPIVALTAGDGRDMTAMLREGIMDGLLTKPVHPSELSDALDSAVWNMPRTAQPRRTDPAPDALIDSGRLEDLQRGLPAGAFADLVEHCLSDILGRLLLLRQAIADGDIEGVSRAAHALSGVAGGYGLTAIEHRMRSVMQAAGAGDLTAAATAIADVDAELERSTALVRSLLQVPVA
jgi:signal transduction histidine kinase/FixJ family two-component response regulator/HPt (histidine-containing phosphotransfer) domain-containing protein